MESTLYGLPMYEIVVDPPLSRLRMCPFSAMGPDKQVSQGIAQTKRTPRPLPCLRASPNSTSTSTSPPGAFYQKTTTADGAYWSLNGKTGGEIGGRRTTPLHLRLQALGHRLPTVSSSWAAPTLPRVLSTPSSAPPPPAMSTWARGPIAPAGGAFIPPSRPPTPPSSASRRRGCSPRSPPPPTSPR